MCLIKKGLYCPNFIVKLLWWRTYIRWHVNKMGRNKEFIKNFVGKVYWKRSFEDLKRIK